MLNFARPSQWAPTERAPLLPAACVQPRVVRLMRDAADAVAPTAPMLLSAPVDPWPNTRGEIHDTRPDILIDVPEPPPVVLRMEPSPPRPELARCYGISCRQGRAPCTEQCAEVASTHPAPARRVPWGITEYTEPARRAPWLACAIGAALFAAGYLVGRVLP